MRPFTIMLMRRFYLGFAAFLVLLAPTAGAQSEVARQKDLDAVRARISTLSQQMEAQTRKRDALVGQLGQTESKLADAQRERRAVRERQQAVTQRLRTAEAEVVLQRQALAKEREALGQQLAAAYRSGRQERLKLLLNPREPAALGRLIVYYDYLNETRLANVTALNAGIEKLRMLAETVQRERAALDVLAASNAALIQELREGQTERQSLVADIDRRLAEEQNLLASLRQQEADLAQLLEELADILADYPIDAEVPMAELEGELTWPVAGRVATRYGQRRGGGMRSKGVVLVADSGTDIRAIYHGRVAYADWLPGMGMLLVIDHGDDLLSLYGYNETLLKDVGDWVTPGEVIATVGNTGGQSRPGLYFELRRGSQPLNPMAWFQGDPD
ncbi:MAG: peptidoglycan DD-metalloendopeptidase family protein [Pseudomonadota bacterium]